MTDYSALLARIAARALEDEPTMPLAHLPAPLRAEDIERAEGRLGFGLHPLLAAVYRDYANGGFGPDYQLLSTGWWDKLENGDDPDLRPWPGFKERASA
ncbi:hypothetical protein [Dactylosporangium sp. CA-092794]|uniref:hypothetical protein n=1 Tax=Dactylosporangium sp. CA-092794 TaxID=3239929 RepID=UPI003D8EB8D2